MKSFDPMNSGGDSDLERELLGMELRRPPAEWKAYFDGYTRDRLEDEGDEFEAAAVEVMSPSFGDQFEVTRAPLMGMTYDEKSNAFELSLGPAPDALGRQRRASLDGGLRDVLRRDRSLGEAFEDLRERELFEAVDAGAAFGGVDEPLLGAVARQHLRRQLEPGADRREADGRMHFAVSTPGRDLAQRLALGHLAVGGSEGFVAHVLDRLAVL